MCQRILGEVRRNSTHQSIKVHISEWELAMVEKERVALCHGIGQILGGNIELYMDNAPIDSGKVLRIRRIDDNEQE